MKTKLDKQEMIEAIYEKVANKKNNPWYWIFSNDKYIYDSVMIWDVLDYIWIWSKTISNTTIKNTYDIEIILDLWESKRFPIEKQNNECIEFINKLL